jgi:D-serine deaminase-like pyridoxal phosphate-dependent protein
MDGGNTLGEPILTRVHQEHGEASPAPMLPIGAKLRVAPNHTCLTAAAFDRYHVVDGSREVIAVWARVNGW